MSALAPGIDPLIAEAKLRMRRRRVLMAVLVLLAGAGVLFLILRPSGAPGTTRVTPHGRNGNGNGSALAHLKVPVDAAERAWRQGINHLYVDASGPTPGGVAQIHERVVSAAHKTGATVVRIRVWEPSGAVEVVVATGTKPSGYLAHRVLPLVSALARGYTYLKVVNGKGSRIFEQYDLPRGGAHDRNAEALVRLLPGRHPLRASLSGEVTREPPRPRPPSGM